MAEELVMPRLSDTMERGTIARWLVREGDRVANGDVLAEIETDKALMELQSYDDGVILRILVQDGETAELGAPIAIVGAEGEEAPEAPAAPAAAAPSAAAVDGARAAGGGADGDGRAPDDDGSAGRTGGLRASPVARRLAEEHNLDLRVLAGRGSGPDGRIVRVDVERLAEKLRGPAALEPAPPPGPAGPAAAPEAPADLESEVVEPTSMQRTIARRMLEAKQQAPHFYLAVDVDMTAALRMRKELNASLAARGAKVSVNDLIVRASALALVEHPQAHRSWVDGRIVQHRSASVGVAVALDDGLVVPVVRHADRRGVVEIAAEIRDLAARAREGRLRQHEIEGGTFTISNLGMFGVDTFNAIINVPEPAILAVGAVRERPAVVEGQVVPRPLMTVTLSADHRALSGADGARLLSGIRERLEQPLLLLV